MKKMILFYLLFAASFQVYAFGSVTPANLDLECQNFISSIEADYYYKWLDVPEKPKSTEMITVFYYYRKSATFKNPVIFFNGAPAIQAIALRMFSKKQKLNSAAKQG